MNRRKATQRILESAEDRGKSRSGFVSRAANAAINGIRRADDTVQALIRDKILRLPNDGEVLPKDAPNRVLREVLGSTVHQARSGYTGDRTKYRAAPGVNNAIGVGLGRALQAGGLTGAGIGLAQLTHAYQNQFGGPADVSDPELMNRGPEYDYQGLVPEERYYGVDGMLPPGDTAGSSEGELLVAGLKGFGPFADVDNYLLASRLNDLNEQMGYPRVHGWGERNSEDM